MTKLSLRAALLAIAGAASGWLFVVTGNYARSHSLNATSPSLNELLFYAAGLFFGLAIVAALLLCRQETTILGAVGLIAASTAAFPVSVVTAFWATLLLGPRGTQNTGDWGAGGVDIPLPAFFAAGAVGAFIILFGALALSGPASLTVRSVWRAALGSMTGGILGMIGLAISETAARAAQSQDPLSKSSALYIIWPAGVALAVAFVVPEQTQAARRNSSLPAMKLIAALFFAAILAFLGWMVRGEVQRARFRASGDAQRRQIDAQRKAVIDKAPSADGLPTVQPVPTEEATIAEDVGEYRAQKPAMQVVPAAAGSPGFAPPVPQHVNYIVSYRPSSTYGAVVATVSRYPNAAWAQYQAKFPYGSEPHSLDYVVIVGKFGNSIYRDSGHPQPNSGIVIFLWPSGATVVNLRFDVAGSLDEDILKRYLEKYPSSL